MRKIFSLAAIASFALTLAGCGGGGDAFTNPDTPPPGGGANPAVSAVTVTSTTATILADGSTSAEITAMVRDANNNLMPDVAIAFTASSGGIAVSQGTTDASGVAKATLTTAGDTSLRTITVTAAAGSVNGTTSVNVVTPPSPPVPTQLTMLTSTPTIPSDGNIPAELTAQVRNANNQFLSGVAITFTSTSGGLTVTQATTDATGTAKATLTSAGDKTNRDITVTAQAGTITQSIVVTVSGTRLSIQGPTALAASQVGTFTVSLTDSGDRAIPGQAVTVASARGNTLSAANLTTDTTGRATFTSTIVATGNDTLTVTSLGMSSTQAVAVNNDTFTFIAPVTDGSEVLLGVVQPLTVRWTSGNAPQVGQTINFSSTRGTLNAASVVTNANGEASVTVSSQNAGGAVVTAAAGTSSAQRALEFVADDADTIDVQPSTFTIAPNEQSTLTAVVRDPAGNLVKNKTVVFTLEDVTGGFLSTASVVTNSQGRAQTVYTAGTTTSANGGVKITAVVQGTTPAVQDLVALTVARKEVFITLGTGNTILEVNANTEYQVDYSIRVTDASGNGVPNVPLSVAILSERYVKGFRVISGTKWITSAVAVCNDEDDNRNGVLDATPVDEDFNNNDKIDAGNIASVSPRNVMTDASGFALVSVTYPQEYGDYLDVNLQALAGVQGTEFVRESRFRLPYAASDFSDVNVVPPGRNSPFGIANTCTNPN